MDSIWVILSLLLWYYCVNLGHNVIIIMILLFLFGARCHYQHDIIGAQWGNLMITLYDIIVFLFLGGVFPRRGPPTRSWRFILPWVIACERPQKHWQAWHS